MASPLRIILLVLYALLFYVVPAKAHDQDRPDLNQWFDHLASGKGLCCSFADGTALADVDWDVKEGHYRVRIEEQWWDVPKEAVIEEPNRAGKTMVWPIFYRPLNAPLRIEIRCFMPGS